MKRHFQSIFLYGYMILAATTAASAFVPSPHAPPGVTPIWIDTDVSIGSPLREVDDAYALLLAFHSRELRIAGISSTYGNGSQAFAHRMAVDLIVRFGANVHLSPRDVIAGASSPRDLGQPSAATEALVTSLRKQRLTYVALGPLTDLATLLRLHPELAPRLREVIFVGGVFKPGTLHLGLLRVHDANVLKDPAAVEIVLRSGIPVRLVPIATAAHLTLTPPEMQALAASGAAGRYLSERSRTWLWFWDHFGRTGGGVVFDALAILAAARPDLVHFENATAQVDPSGNLVAQPTRTHSDRVRICVGYRNAVKEWMIARLSHPD